MRPCRLCLLILIPACTSPDTPPLDGLTSGNVKVVVTDPGGPRPGVAVAFVDAAGAEVASGMTGADGAARHDLPAGGSVTVFDGQLVTFLDIQPGDELHVGEAPEAALVGSVHVTPPGEYAGAAQYGLELGCLVDSPLDPTGDQSFDLDPACVGADGKVAVLAHADDENGKPIAYSGARGLALDGGVAEARLPAWQPARSFALDVAGAESWAASYDAEVSFVAGGVSLSLWDGGAGGGEPMPAAGFVDQLAFQLEGMEAEPPSGFRAASGATLTGRAPAATIQLDATAVPPHLTSVTLDGPRISWQTDRPYAAASAATVLLSWGAQGFWTVVGPPTSPFVLPTLPKSLAAHGPTAATTDLEVDTLLLQEISDSTSYRAWIANHHGVLVDFAKVAPVDVATARVGYALAAR